MVLPGINEDIVRGNRTYHLQTEDRGTHNPAIVGVLFLEGAVLVTERVPYEELLETRGAEREIKKRMIRVHRNLLRRILEGEFDAVEVQRQSQPEREPLLSLEHVSEPALGVGRPGRRAAALMPRIPSPIPDVGNPFDQPFAAAPGRGSDEILATPAILVDEPATGPLDTGGLPATGFCADVITSRSFDLVVALELARLEGAGRGALA